MKAKDFDKKFDKGEDITKYLDVSKRHRPEQEQKRVNVDDLVKSHKHGHPGESRGPERLENTGFPPSPE